MESSKKRKILVCILPFVIALGAVAVALLVLKLGLLPKCMLHKYTGLYCPGCGCSRAVVALLHGDILLSLRQNPIIVLLIVCGAILYTEPLAKTFGKTNYRCPIRNWQFFYVMIGIITAFTIARNFIPAIAPIPNPF